VGLEVRVKFPAAPVVDWGGLLVGLAASGRPASGRPASVKMIDDLPAFPDEIPPEEWREVRLGFAAGMVTVRRAGTDLACVVWGSADAELAAAQAAVAQALAGQGGGVVSPPPG